MRIIWSIKDLVNIGKERQQNEFDLNIVITGVRGNGKSTLAFRFFTRFGKKFKPWKHQIYSRKDLMKLLERTKYGCIFDDEAIRTGYKRNFFDQDQKLLIQMLNMYRDNYNIYVACIPNFYNLDKDLRDLFKIHIHIIERGMGVIHVANESSLYSDDKWDIKYNKKIEDGWAKRKQNNINYKPKYNRLSTFKGYIKIPKLTAKQEILYKEVKDTKRKLMYEEEIKGEEIEGNVGFYERIIQRLMEGKLTQEMLQEISLANGLKYSAVRSLLNIKLRDAGEKPVGSFLKVAKKPLLHNKITSHKNDKKPKII